MKSKIEKVLIELNDAHACFRGKGDFGPDERRQLVGDRITAILEESTNV